MKRAFAALATAAVVAIPAAGATAGPQVVDADVESVATVTSQVETVFDFNVYNCPAGEPMEIVLWEASQPNRPGSLVAAAGVPYGLSNGDRVQHLTLAANGDFLAGERWVGSGEVACGLAVVPVTGSGTTKSLNGV